MRRGRPSTLAVDFADDEDAFGPTSVSLKVYRGDLLVPEGAPLVELPAVLVGAVWRATYTPVALGRYTGFWSWADGYQRVILDVIDAPVCSIAAIRGFEVELRDTTRYPVGLLAAARDAVTDEFGRIVGRSFVVRAGRIVERVDQDTTYLGLPDYDVIEVALSVDGIASTATVDLSGALGILAFAPGTFPDGTALTVDYRYGLPEVPADVHRAALLRIRDVVLSRDNAIPDRATSFQITDGGSYTLATAGRAGYETGLPEVDAVLSRYKPTVLNSMWGLT